MLGNLLTWAKKSVVDADWASLPDQCLFRLVHSPGWESKTLKDTMNSCLRVLSGLLLLGYSIGSEHAPQEEEEAAAIIPEDTRNFKLTVIVLTMNRHWSLVRLLQSLEATEFDDAEDFFNLEIHVDKSIGEHYEDCVKIAHNYTLPHGGSVKAKIAPANQGLRAAWFNACYPWADDEFCIIIEDDLEMSPYWYTWLKKAWTQYQDRDDMAGIALQRQYLVFQKPEQQNREIINNYEPFLYKLVGTWAFAPHPKKWREFLEWFHSMDHDKFDPYVPGLLTSDWLHMHTSMGKRHMTWEQWHIYYSEKHGLYTMYINFPKGMALTSNWREAGVHNRRSFNSKDYPTLDYCAIQLQEFPEDLKRFGWDAREEVLEGEDRITSFEFGANNL